MENMEDKKGTTDFPVARPGRGDFTLSRDKVLETIAKITSLFLKVAEVSEAIHQSIASVGAALGVERVGVQLDKTATCSDALKQTVFSWTAQGQPLISETEGATADLLGRLRNGEQVCISVKEAGGEASTGLSDNGVGSACFVPVVCETSYAGFLTLQTTDANRSWSGIEQDALRTVAVTLGAALERDSVRQALKESEAFWRSLYDNAPQIIFITDPDGIITSCNAETSRTVEGELIGRSIYEFMFESDTERVRRIFNKTVSTGERTSFDISVPGESTRHYFVTLGPIVDEREGVVAVTAIVNDITQRVHHREELEMSRRHIESVAETVPEMLYVFDLVLNRITYVNSRIKDVLGFSPEEIVNRVDSTQLLHPDDVQRVEGDLEKLKEWIEEDRLFRELSIRMERVNVWESDHACASFTED